MRDVTKHIRNVLPARQVVGVIQAASVNEIRDILSPKVGRCSDCEIWNWQSADMQTSLHAQLLQFKGKGGGVGLANAMASRMEQGGCAGFDEKEFKKFVDTNKVYCIPVPGLVETTVKSLLKTYQVRLAEQHCERVLLGRLSDHLPIIPSVQQLPITSFAHLITDHRIRSDADRGPGHTSASGISSSLSSTSRAWTPPSSPRRWFWRTTGPTPPTTTRCCGCCCCSAAFHHLLLVVGVDVLGVLVPVVVLVLVVVGVVFVVAPDSCLPTTTSLPTTHSRRHWQSTVTRYSPSNSHPTNSTPSPQNVNVAPQAPSLHCRSCPHRLAYFGVASAFIAVVVLLLVVFCR